MDEDGSPAEDSAERVHIPRTSFELTIEQLDHLKRSVDPLEQCQNYGIDVYFRVIDILNTFDSMCELLI